MENLSKHNYYHKDDDVLLDANDQINYESASGWKRFFNYIIDIIAFYIIIFIIAIAFGFLGMAEMLTKTNIYILSALILILYYSLTEGISGRTLGKLITGTKVITEDGGNPGFTKILVRTLCRFIPFEAFSFLGDGTGWHDTITKTRVVVIPKNNIDTILNS